MVLRRNYLRTTTQHSAVICSRSSPSDGAFRFISDAHVASGNGIAERCHRSVKRTAARKKCSSTEPVYWYNMAPKDGADPSTAQANKLYSYNLRVHGIDCAPPEERPEIGNPYHIGDAVWVKPPGSRCDMRFTRGTVSKVMSDVAVEVNRMPWHIRDLHRRMEDLSDDNNLVVKRTCLHHCQMTAPTWTLKHLPRKYPHHHPASLGPGGAFV